MMFQYWELRFTISTITFARHVISWKSEKWCTHKFPGFIERATWPLNSLDLNPLDYCIWDEFCKAIDLEKGTSKISPIIELKCAVKKIWIDVVRE